MPHKPLTAEQKAARKAARIKRELYAPPREREKSIEDRASEAMTALGCLVERRGENQGKRNDNHETGEPDRRVSFRRTTWGIEFKRDAKETLRPKQIEWYRKHSNNVTYFVCCSVDQAIDTIRLAYDESFAGAYDLRSGRVVVLS